MPSVLSILPEYKGLTTEDISKMYTEYNKGMKDYETKRDSYYEKYGEQYTNLGQLKAVLDKYSNNESDKPYIEAYNNYVDKLQNSVNDMIQNGYSTRTARDLAFLTGEYNMIASAVGDAEKARSSAIKDYYTKINSGNYISTYDPTTSTLSDYMSASPRSALYADLDKVYKTAVAVASSYASKNYGTYFGIDEKDLGDNKYSTYTKTKGYKNLNIDNDQFLNNQIDSILSHQGITKGNGFSDDQIAQAKGVVQTGYRDGIIYEESTTLLNIGDSEAKKEEVKKKEEKRKKLIEYRLEGLSVKGSGDYFGEDDFAISLESLNGKRKDNNLLTEDQKNMVSYAKHLWKVLSNESSIVLSNGDKIVKMEQQYKINEKGEYNEKVVKEKIITDAFRMYLL